MVGLSKRGTVMTDLSHLDALTARLARETSRLEAATNDNERAFRARAIVFCEKEIEAEYKFLGIDKTVSCDLSDDELLAALTEK